MIVIRAVDNGPGRTLEGAGPKNKFRPVHSFSRNFVNYKLRIS